MIVLKNLPDGSPTIKGYVTDPGLRLDTLYKMASNLKCNTSYKEMEDITIKLAENNIEMGVMEEITIMSSNSTLVTFILSIEQSLIVSKETDDKLHEYLSLQWEGYMDDSIIKHTVNIPDSYDELTILTYNQSILLKEFKEREKKYERTIKWLTSLAFEEDNKRFIEDPIDINVTMHLNLDRQTEH